MQPGTPPPGACPHCCRGLRRARRPGNLRRRHDRPEPRDTGGRGDRPAQAGQRAAGRPVPGRRPGPGGRDRSAARRASGHTARGRGWARPPLARPGPCRTPASLAVRRAVHRGAGAAGADRGGLPSRADLRRYAQVPLRRVARLRAVRVHAGPEDRAGRRGPGHGRRAPAPARPGHGRHPVCRAAAPRHPPLAGRPHHRAGAARRLPVADGTHDHARRAVRGARAGGAGRAAMAAGGHRRVRRRRGGDPRRVGDRDAVGRDPGRARGDLRARRRRRPAQGHGQHRRAGRRIRRGDPRVLRRLLHP